MDVFLYDSIADMPEDNGNHIVVFAGLGSLLQDSVQEMVTETLCTYRIGDTYVEFARNGDAENVRFEQAFSWAIKYAAARNIDRVYGVYELDRPLDKNHLDRILASGLIDKRERTLLFEDDACDAPLLCPNCSSALSKAPVEFETALGAI
ncbi:MAG: hypothetical protein OXT06_07625 [Rhodospirillaceae bacterium]|nr:hypothetical protein [Rhodospirillaceae bacterium]